MGPCIMMTMSSLASLECAMSFWLCRCDGHAAKLRSMETWQPHEEEHRVARLADSAVKKTAVSQRIMKQPVSKQKSSENILIYLWLCRFTFFQCLRTEFVGRFSTHLFAEQLRSRSIPRISTGLAVQLFEGRGGRAWQGRHSFSDQKANESKRPLQKIACRAVHRWFQKAECTSTSAHDLGSFNFPAGSTSGPWTAGNKRLPKSMQVG